MLLIALEGRAVLLGQALVDGAVLEDLERRDLAVDVVRHNLQAVENQGLPHDIEVRAQRIDERNALFLRESLKSLVI